MGIPCDFRWLFFEICGDPIGMLWETFKIPVGINLQTFAKIFRSFFYFFIILPTCDLLCTVNENVTKDFHLNVGFCIKFGR